MSSQVFFFIWSLSFQLTLADLAVYNAFDTPVMQVPSMLDSYPKMKAHRAMVGGVPKLAEYVKNRKKTDI